MFFLSKAICRRHVLKGYAHAHAFLQVTGMSNLFQSILTCLRTQGSQIVCSFLTLLEWQPSIRRKSEGYFSIISSQISGGRY